jgi:perosamine synthetase
MFGIAMAGLSGLSTKFPGVTVIEDCAQSFGSKIAGSPAGNLGDISFFSFNRGKNLPTYGGGCIVTNNQNLAVKIESSLRKCITDKPDPGFLILFRLLALCLAIKPPVYGAFYGLISRFRETAHPKDFTISQYAPFQAYLALELMKQIEALSRRRFLNGMRLIKGLKGVDAVILPHVAENTEPAFNRLPVVFKDIKKRQDAQKQLWKAGIESSRMYFKPLHHIFDLGYRKDELPNAVYFAERVLTLPTHPSVTEQDLEKIIDLIKKC